MLINVVYADGKVTPAAGTVTVASGDRVKVRVTSDQHQNIEVSGDPDKTSDVDPDEPEGVDFTASESPNTITLQPAGVTLVTVSAQ